MNLNDFKDNNGKQLQEPKELAKIMQNKGLIIQNSNQDFVYEIAINNKFTYANEIRWTPIKTVAEWSKWNSHISSSVFADQF